jgi:hypothetical protein
MQPNSPSDATVASIANERGIEEVLHFTTNKGLLGIFATGKLLSRDRLPKEKYIEHIYTPNCENRLKDAEWTDYINMSIARVNGSMLGVSENWHSTEDLWWVVLSFECSILSDEGVYFTTTNNTYTRCVRRATGAKGLNALFAETVEWGWYGSRHRRRPSTPASWTTDVQAEVLYPGELSLDRLQAIYVREEEHVDTVRGWFAVWPAARVPVQHKPEVFR